MTRSYMTHMTVTRWVRSAWSFLRTASGDDAYERYLVHHTNVHAGQLPMSRRAFYEQTQRRKWSGVNRCC